MGLVKVGATSWTEPTLVKSGWYPPGTGSAEGRLRYYASRFPIVENDSAYYAIPRVEAAEAWVERTPPHFTMNVKAFAPFTMHYTDPKRLPPDLQASLQKEVREKRHVYPRDLGPELIDELAVRFQEALRPLESAGKLGAVLFQLAPWFVISRQNKAHLVRVRRMFPRWRIAVELRNPTWLEERNREETFAFLAEHDLAYVTVDSPPGAKLSVPAVPAVTTPALAVVRFHGRDRAAWEKKTRTAAERFPYLYPEAELAEWVAPIRGLARQADEVHVLMNNCYRDHAVVNAEQLGALLGGVEVDVPTRERAASAGR